MAEEKEVLIDEIKSLVESEESNSNSDLAEKVSDSIKPQQSEDQESNKEILQEVEIQSQTELEVKTDLKEGEDSEPAVEEDTSSEKHSNEV